MSINRPSANNEEWRIFTEAQGTRCLRLGTQKDPRFAGLFCARAGLGTVTVGSAAHFLKT